MSIVTPWAAQQAAAQQQASGAGREFALRQAEVLAWQSPFNTRAALEAELGCLLREYDILTSGIGELQRQLATLPPDPSTPA